jgi:hypothetical protein
VALVALCISCQPELVSIEPVNQNTINITLDSWQHIESKYPKVANNIKQLKQQAQLNRYSSNYNFYINDSTVQVIEQPNYTTFTFFVYRDSITPNILENYTYKLYNDGTYQQFLLKYHYTLDQDLNKVFSQTHFDIEAIDDHSLLYGRTNSCMPEFETVQTGVICTVAAKCTGGAKHEAGHPECICEDDPGCDPGGSMSCNPTYTVVYNSCGGGTNNGPDPNQNTNTTQGGNTQDPNSQPDPNNNSTIATPLEDTTPAWQGILDCINNPNLLETDTTTLDPDIFESLGLSKATYQAITNYLDENQCSERAQNFVIEAFHAILNNGEVDFEEQIINELKDKALCVYNQLVSSNSGFKEMIRKFDGEFPVSHLKFEIDESMSSNTRKAYTRPPQSYIIDIVLNGNPAKDASYQKRPNLLVAKTIIHEVIHAEIFRKILSLANDNGQIDVASAHIMLQNGDYPGILDYYTRFGINGFQHQQMAAHYRETIGRMLQEFDTGIVVPDNQQPNQLYMDLAWEGLIYSNIAEWQNIMDDTERERIEDVIDNYISENINETCTE